MEPISSAVVKTVAASVLVTFILGIGTNTVQNARQDVEIEHLKDMAVIIVELNDKIEEANRNLSILNDRAERALED